MPIEQTEVLISTPDGQMPAVLFTPTHPDRQSAILLLMEAFGLTSHIQDVAARIAHEGYVVIIPDLYYRELPHNKVDSLNKLPNALIKARIAAKISQQELADILGIDEQRVYEYEDTDYQCASFVEILEVTTALGVEFEIATVQVDFAEIEAVKKSVDKWRKEKLNIKTRAS
ncbi:MAG: dienelactone hydrolase family protein [Nostoc sp.]|uniref:dienelactone hydrolase family protein n=2 Tax=Nostoc sp. TaxID=1180 RepID=UPI002FFBD9C1